jgi:hypothetical protein
MYKVRIAVKVVVCFLLLYTVSIFSVDIGSDTAVTRFNTQQIVEDGDRIAGFASLAAGFLFNNPQVTGDFDCFFPVEGDVSLRFGILQLNQDLIFHNNFSLSTLGNIVGNSHVIELSSNIDCIPNTTTFCSVTFLDTIDTGDDVFSVDWNADGSFIAIGRDNNKGNEVQIYSWDGTTLTLITGVSLGQDVRSVSWHPTLDRLAVGRYGGKGSELYLYSFNGVTLTLLDSVSLGGTADDVNEVAFDPSGDYLAVAKGAPFELLVYDVSAGTFGSSVGVNLADHALSVGWDSIGNFLVVGLDLHGGTELQVYEFTTGPLALTLDASTEIGADVNAVDWNKVSPNSDVIAIGTDLLTDALMLFRYSTGSLTEIPITPVVTTEINSLQWRIDGVCLAIGMESNTAGEIRIFSFENDDLTFEGDVEVGSATNSVRWSRSGSYLASGDDANDLETYQFDAAFVDTSRVLFSDVQLYLNGDVTFRDTSIVFSGQSSIHGRGNTITLSPTFSLLVDEDGSLLLQDLIIKGVSESKIRGLDERSTFSLLNTEFELDGDYTFTEGKFDILGDFTISGTHTLNYTAEQQSIIRGGAFSSEECSPIYCGSLIVDEGATFSYVPANNLATLLSMESEISKIVLNGGNLHASTLELTNGTFQAFGRSTINAESLTFGDGTQENNLCIDIKGAQLEVSGNLINNNV